MSKFDWLPWISHSTQFTACADQLLYSLSLIKWCLTCVKQNSSKDCNRCLFILSKIDMLWSTRRTREFININFEQAIEPFLVFNIYFTFSLSVVDYTFYKSTIKGNCILLLCRARVRSSCQELFCKKSILRNFAKFTGKRLC